MADPGRDRFRTLAIIGLILAGVAMLAGVALVLAAFFWIGA